MLVPHKQHQLPTAASVLTTGTRTSIPYCNQTTTEACFDEGVVVCGTCGHARFSVWRLFLLHDKSLNCDVRLAMLVALIFVVVVVLSVMLVVVCVVLVVVAVTVVLLSIVVVSAVLVLVVSVVVVMVVSVVMVVEVVVQVLWFQ